MRMIDCANPIFTILIGTHSHFLENTDTIKKWSASQNRIGIIPYHLSRTYKRKHFTSVSSNYYFVVKLNEINRVERMKI